MSKSVLIIVPCYNERETITDLYREIKEKAPYDIIVVNDHSTDDSKIVLQRGKIPHLDLPLNLGIGGAVQTGYRYALRNGYDIAVQLDGDGQHDPGFIDELIAPVIRDEADLVIGSRYINNTGYRSSVMRRTGIRYFRWLILCLSGKRITDATSGFRAANRLAIELFNSHYSADYPEPDSIILALRSKLRVCEVPVVMRKRQGGESSIKALQPIYYMIKVSLSILISFIHPKAIRKG